MKILFNTVILTASLVATAAQYRPLPVDANSQLSPTSKFISANEIVVQDDIKTRRFQQDFRIFVDTTQSVGQHNSTTVQWWTDTEVKGADKWNNHIFFTTTIALNNGQVVGLHPTWLLDKTPKIYYWFNNTSNNAGGCWGERRQLTNFNSSIGAVAGNYGITGIWIYPSLDSQEYRAVPVYKGPGVLDTTNYPKKGKGDNSSVSNLRAGWRWVKWGDYLREIFNNPDNTFIAWRQTKSTGEYYDGSEKLWRPIKIQYYGDFKEVK